RTGPHLLGESETFEHLQASQFLTPELPYRRRPREPPVERHEPSRSPVTDECPVDLRELKPLDGLPSRLHDLALRAIAERLRRQVLTAPADALPQVIGMDLEALASGVPTAEEEMNVRVVGVVVIHGHPLESRPQVALHVRDERPCVRLEIQALGVLGRDDELPQALVAGPLPAPEGRRKVDALLLGTEPATLPAPTLRAVARQVRPVRGPRRAPAVPGVGGLHGAPLPACIHAAEKRAAAAQPAPTLTSAPSTAPRPSWRRWATAPMVRGQPCGEPQVIARDRHHAAASTRTAWLRGRINRPSGPRDRPHLRRRDRPEVSAVPAVRNPRSDEPELAGCDDVPSPRDMR